MSRRLSLMVRIWLVTIAWASQVGYSLTWAQQDELYRTGEVTIWLDDGQKAGRWLVKMMPGADLVKAEAMKRWKEGLYLITAAVAHPWQFWGEGFFGQVGAGAKYMKQCVWDEGVFAIPADYRDTCQRNCRVQGHFNGGAMTLKNWLAFGGSSVARGVRSAWGVVAGGTYSLVAPWVYLIGRPVLGGVECALAGTAWPVLKFAWNHYQWTQLKDKEFLDKKGDLSITWIQAPSAVQARGAQEAELELPAASSSE